MTPSPIKAANRTRLISPFKVMKVLLRAQQLELAGKKIVHMEVGEPDFSTAEPIIEAAQIAMHKGQTHYSAAAGIIELRDAISNFYAEQHSVSVNPERIFITPGASGGLNLLSNLLVNGGDGILMADPAYPCNRNYIHLMGGEPQMVAVGSETKFHLTKALLEKHLQSNSRGLWLASPANPTGKVIDRDQLKELSAWTEEKQMHLLMDEIYHGLHYVEDLPSLLELNNQGFIVNSFSKYFGMTGWRIGWIVVPDHFIDLVEILSQNLFIAASTISQHAALAAFAPSTLEILEQRRSEFRQRRDFLSNALKEIGFTVPVNTEGAFYIYAGIEKFSNDSELFCSQLLEQHGVAVTPGTDFGEYRANQFVRFAFTTDMGNLELGVERLRKALNS